MVHDPRGHSFGHNGVVVGSLCIIEVRVGAQKLLALQFVRRRISDCKVISPLRDGYQYYSEGSGGGEDRH